MQLSLPGQFEPRTVSALGARDFGKRLLFLENLVDEALLCHFLEQVFR
jgi:hypothetical protein